MSRVCVLLTNRPWSRSMNMMDTEAIAENSEQLRCERDESDKCVERWMISLQSEMIKNTRSREERHSPTHRYPPTRHPKPSNKTLVTTTHPASPICSRRVYLFLESVQRYLDIHMNISKYSAHNELRDEVKPYPSLWERCCTRSANSANHIYAAE